MCACVISAPPRFKYTQIPTCAHESRPDYNASDVRVCVRVPNENTHTHTHFKCTAVLWRGLQNTFRTLCSGPLKPRALCDRTPSAARAFLSTEKECCHHKHACMSSARSIRCDLLCGNRVAVATISSVWCVCSNKTMRQARTPEVYYSKPLSG